MTSISDFAKSASRSKGWGAKVSNPYRFLKEAKAMTPKCMLTDRPEASFLQHTCQENAQRSATHDDIIFRRPLKIACGPPCKCGGLALWVRLILL